MMELAFFLRLCVLFFAIMGYLRGIYKEFVGLTGIILSLYLLTEFGWIIDLIFGGSGATWRFTVDASILIMLTFFAYQQAPSMFVPRNYRTSRGGLRIPGEGTWQAGLLGAIFGGFNGYLVVGSLWYLMDQLEYPLSPLFTQPAINSSSAAFVTNLPLVWLQGNILVALVMGLFLLIIIFR